MKVAADIGAVHRVVTMGGVRPRVLLRPVALLTASMTSALALAVLSAWLITKAWTMPPVLSLTIAVTSVRALGISRGLLRYLERLASHRVALAAMTRLRSALFHRLASGDPGPVIRTSPSRVAERGGRDVDDISCAIVRALIPIPMAIVLGGVAVVVVAWVSLVAALVLGLTLLFGGVAIGWAATRSARLDAIAQVTAREDAAWATRALLHHGDELAVTGRFDEIARYASEAEDTRIAALDRTERAAAVSAALLPLVRGFSVMALVVIGIGVGAHGASPMALGVLLLTPLAAFEATSLLQDAGLALRSATIGAQRYLALWDAAGPAGTEPPEADSDGVVRVTDMRWGFDGTPLVTEPVSFTLGSGGRAIVYGRSGVGKSALAMTLAGVIAPIEGTVRGGADATYFAEDAHIFSTTVRDNLLVARGNASDEELMGVLVSVGLGEWTAGLPDGLATVLPTGADEISAGQRRRLLLARALLHPSPVVIVDEPTEHLDDQSSAELLDRILAQPGLFGDRSVVVITHHGVGGKTRCTTSRLSVASSSHREEVVRIDFTTDE